VFSHYIRIRHIVSFRCPFAHMQAVVAALFMNIYIVGLNQLFDIEIDKVP
jgi:4-hydroxybenzoate polyprenyltransferase